LNVGALIKDADHMVMIQGTGTQAPGRIGKD